MTEQEFLKKSFKPFMQIRFTSNKIENMEGQMGVEIDCMLMGVDFDQRLLRLQAYPKGYYEPEVFWARCEYCETPKKEVKLKIVRAVRPFSKREPNDK